MSCLMLNAEALLYTTFTINSLQNTSRIRFPTGCQRVCNAFIHLHKIRWDFFAVLGIFIVIFFRPMLLGTGTVYDENIYSSIRDSYVSPSERPPIPIPQVKQSNSMEIWIFVIRLFFVSRHKIQYN